MNIFADGLTNVTLSNNNIRITLIQNGPDKQQTEAGTLIIPAVVAPAFVNAMAKSLKQLETQIRSQIEESKNAAAAGDNQ